MEFGKEKFIYCTKIYCHLLLWKVILRGLFGVSSPRPVEKRVAPQPTEPIENETPFEIPSGMMEKLLTNTFTGENKAS